jgi:hypothetical protein
MKTCKICADAAKTEEVNTVLSAGEMLASIAEITGCSKSAVYRHSQHPTGAPGGNQSREVWARILKNAEHTHDTIGQIRAQKAIDAIDAAERAEAQKPKFSGPEAEAASLIASYKHSWRLCHQCRMLEILGHYRFPPASSEAFVTKLCGLLMNWAETEAVQEKPRMELVGAAGWLCAELLGRPWPLEYRAPVERFAEAMRDSDAVELFAAELRGLDNKEKPNEVVG